MSFIATKTLPAGSNTQVQLNNNGVFGADSLFAYNLATHSLGVNQATPLAQADFQGGQLRAGQSDTTFTQTTDNPLTAGATTINVGSTTNFPPSGILILSPFNQTGNAEYVSYTGTTATSFTGVTRGLYGTTGVSHAVNCNIVCPLLFVAPNTTTAPTLVVFHWNGAPTVWSGINAAGLTNGNITGLAAQSLYATNGVFTTPSGQVFLRATSTNAVNIGDNSAQPVNIGDGGGGVNFSSTKATIDSNGALTKYKNVNTAGWGIPVVQGNGRSVAQTAAVASVAAYTVGAADGSFIVDANVLVTTSTTHNFTVTCAYTDEGNTARTLTFNFSNVGGTIATAIANAGGAVPYEGIPLHIRCKASTSITIATTGTFTTVTYNVEGSIRQIA